MDLIVTTPKRDSAQAAAEAASMLAAGGGLYFRRLATYRININLHPGDRLFYVEDGYIRGYALVVEVTQDAARLCSTTGREWGPGTYAVMDATTWTWVRPDPHVGFRGWRYFIGGDELEVVGDWKSPRPAAP